MNNIGYIYKITNLINGNCYIGQTSKPVKLRWKEHKKDATDISRGKYEYPLYRAFRKYGFENFSFEIIEKCKISELNDKEIYWINFYNSYHDGYNQCLGGEGKKILELNEKEIIEQYSKIQNIQKVARLNNCSSQSISNILNKHNIPIKSAHDHTIENAYDTYRLDKNGQILEIYESIIEAGRWLKNQGLSDKNDNANYIAIRTAILMGYSSHGYYWDSDQYSYKDKLDFRSKTLEIRNIRENKPKPCPLCGNLMSSYSTICISCHNQQNSQNAIKEKQEKGITREYLKNEIRNKPFTQIGKEQGVSDNAIRKWCKLYNLPSKISEIKKYSDKEWENI